MSYEGRDIYEGNGDFPAEWFAQWDFVYIRAYNERGRLDSRFVQNWDRSRGQTRRGAYGWPIHGADNTQLGRQLAALASDAELIPMADFEHSGAGLATVAELEAYVRGCDGGFYSNLSELPRTPYLNTRPWWFANPSGNRPPRPVALTQYGIVNGIDANRCDDLHPILREDAMTPEQEQLLKEIHAFTSALWKGFPTEAPPASAEAVPLSLQKLLAGHGSSTGGGLDADEVRAIVREELNKTHLGGT